MAVTREVTPFRLLAKRSVMDHLKTFLHNPGSQAENLDCLARSHGREPSTNPSERPDHRRHPSAYKNQGGWTSTFHPRLIRTFLGTVSVHRIRRAYRPYRHSPLFPSHGPVPVSPAHRITSFFLTRCPSVSKPLLRGIVQLFPQIPLVTFRRLTFFTPRSQLMLQFLMPGLKSPTQGRLILLSSPQ